MLQRLSKKMKIQIVLLLFGFVAVISARPGPDDDVGVNDSNADDTNHEAAEDEEDPEMDAFRDDELEREAFGDDEPEMDAFRNSGQLMDRSGEEHPGMRDDDLQLDAE